MRKFKIQIQELNGTDNLLGADEMSLEECFKLKEEIEKLNKEVNERMSLLNRYLNR